MTPVPDLLAEHGVAVVFGWAFAAVRQILAARRPAETLGPGPPAPAEAPAITA